MEISQSPMHLLGLLVCLQCEALTFLAADQPSASSDLAQKLFLLSVLHAERGLLSQKKLNLLVFADDRFLVLQTSGILQFDGTRLCLQFLTQPCQQIREMIDLGLLRLWVRRLRLEGRFPFEQTKIRVQIDLDMRELGPRICQISGVGQIIACEGKLVSQFFILLHLFAKVSI